MPQLIYKCTRSLRFSHTQSMDVEEVSEKTLDIEPARYLRIYAFRVTSRIKMREVRNSRIYSKNKCKLTPK